jgi:hypothetical protein
MNTPELLVIDEAHLLKNEKTNRWKMVRAMSAKTVIALTGTPIQNSPMDLFNITTLIQPGVFGDKLNFRLMLTQDRSNKSTSVMAYANTIRELSATLIHRKDADSVFKSNFNSMEYLITFDGGVQQDPRISCFKAHEEMLTSSKPRRSYFTQIILDACISEGHSVIVFSQRLNFLQELYSFNQSNGSNPLYLDGDNSDQAQFLSDKFQTDPSHRIFFISKMVGCLGLTLTRATRIIIADQMWNPQTDKQAMYRSMRIGQLNDVHTYRLICATSSEVRIKRRQISKLLCADRLVDNQDMYETFDTDYMLEYFPNDDQEDCLDKNDSRMDSVCLHLAQYAGVLRFQTPDMLAKQLETNLDPSHQFKLINDNYRILYYENDYNMIQNSSDEGFGQDSSPILFITCDPNVSQALGEKGLFLKLTVRTRPYDPERMIYEFRYIHSVDGCSDWFHITHFVSGGSDMVFLYIDQTLLPPVGEMLGYINLRARPDWTQFYDRDPTMETDIPSHLAVSTPTGDILI